MLSRAGQRRLGGFNLSLGSAVLGLGIVQFLLRNQTRTGRRCLLQTQRIGMHGRVVGFGTRDLVLGALYLLLAVPDSGPCTQ